MEHIKVGTSELRTHQFMRFLKTETRYRRIDRWTIISVALQHGISAVALAKSVGRVPSAMVTPADLDRVQPGRVPASPIGAALDLVCSFENGTTE